MCVRAASRGSPAYPRLLPGDTQAALTRRPHSIAPAEVTSATPLSLPPRQRTGASPDAPAREALRGKPHTTTSGGLPAAPTAKPRPARTSPRRPVIGCQGSAARRSAELIGSQGPWDPMEGSPTRAPLVTAGDSRTKQSRTRSDDAHP